MLWICQPKQYCYILWNCIIKKSVCMISRFWRAKRRIKQETTSEQWWSQNSRTKIFTFLLFLCSSHIIFETSHVCMSKFLLEMVYHLRLAVVNISSQWDQIYQYWLTCGVWYYDILHALFIKTFNCYFESKLW